jgi:hypothetical protein
MISALHVLRHLALTAAGSCLAAVVTGCASPPQLENFGFPASDHAASADPALALDPVSGDVLATWMQDESDGHWRIRFSRRSELDGMWSQTVDVSPEGEPIVPHAESAQRLIASPTGVLAVVWSDSREIPGRPWPASNIRFSRSTDGGRTWSSATTLNDDTTTGPSGHLFHGVATFGDSGLVAAWLDSRGVDSVARMAGPTVSAADSAHAGHMEHGGHAAGGAVEPDARVMLAISHDLGSTWEQANVIAATDACPCCRVTLARDAEGGVSGAWRRHFGENVRDVVVGKLVPRVEEAIRVHDDGWVFHGCPHSGPGLSIASDGRAHVAWFTGTDGGAGVFYAMAAAGSTYGKPVPLSIGVSHPVTHATVAAGSKGRAMVTWEDTLGADRRVSFAIVSRGRRVVHSEALTGTEGSDHPQVIALPDGSFVLAWTVKTTEGPRLQGVRAW